MYVIKYNPPKGGLHIGGFTRSNFKSKRDAIDWLVENKFCTECKLSFINKPGQEAACLLDWEITHVEELAKVAFRETSDIASKVLLEHLKMQGVSSEQINAALNETFMISCMESNKYIDSDPERSRLWASVALIIERYL